jgi:hypothetical protein
MPLSKIRYCTQDTEKLLLNLSFGLCSIAERSDLVMISYRSRSERSVKLLA